MHRIETFELARSHSQPGCLPRHGRRAEGGGRPGSLPWPRPHHGHHRTLRRTLPGGIHTGEDQAKCSALHCSCMERHGVLTHGHVQDPHTFNPAPPLMASLYIDMSKSLTCRYLHRCNPTRIVASPQVRSRLIDRWGHRVPSPVLNFASGCAAAAGSTLSEWPCIDR